MLVPFPRSAEMLFVYLMVLTQTFQYQDAKPVTSDAVRTIQNLYNETGCELPVSCYDTETGGRCCYDCSECQDIHCSNHWQCCSNEGPGSNFETVQRLSYVECTKVVRMDNANNKGLSTKPLSYEMITSCPQGTFENIAEMCTNAHDGQPVFLSIPWLDANYLQNGLIYRNAFCLLCHNPHLGDRIEGTSFNLALTRHPRHYYDQFKSLQIESRSDIVEFNLAGLSTTDTLVLSATLLGTEASRHALKPPCGFSYDLDLCQNASQSHLKDACANIHAPINVRNSATNQTYLAQNLACAYCVLGDHLSIPTEDSQGHKRCRVKTQEQPWLLMNPVLFGGKLLTNDPSDDVRNLSEWYTGTGNTSCHQGSFFDQVSSTCRKILCPRHHFIYQGKCHPTFTYSVGQSYYIKVKVPVQQDAWSVDFLDKLGLAVFDAILNQSNFHLCDLKVHAKLNLTREYIEYALFEIFFFPPNGTVYQDVWKAIKPLIMSTFRCNIVFDKRKYDIETTGNVYFSRTEPGRLIDYNDALPLELLTDTTQSFHKRRVNTTGSFNEPRYCHSPIRLTKLDFCSRFILNQHGDISQLETVYGEDWEQMSDDAIAVCIQNDEENATDHYCGYDNDANEKTDDASFNYTPIIVVSSVLGAVAAVSVFVGICCLAKRTDRDTFKAKPKNEVGSYSRGHKLTRQRVIKTKSNEIRASRESCTNAREDN